MEKANTASLKFKSNYKYPYCLLFAVYFHGRGLMVSTASKLTLFTELPPHMPNVVARSVHVCVSK